MLNHISGALKLRRVILVGTWYDYGQTDRVFITRQRRGLTPTIKRELRRRSAIEPMIGHMKADGRLGRNHCNRPFKAALRSVSRCVSLRR